MMVSKVHKDWMSVAKFIDSPMNTWQDILLLNTIVNLLSVLDEKSGITTVNDVPNYNVNNVRSKV